MWLLRHRNIVKRFVCKLLLHMKCLCVVPLKKKYVFLRKTASNTYSLRFRFNVKCTFSVSSHGKKATISFYSCPMGVEAQPTLIRCVCVICIEYRFKFKAICASNVQSVSSVYFSRLSLIFRLATFWVTKTNIWCFWAFSWILFLLRLFSLINQQITAVDRVFTWSKAFSSEIISAHCKII